MPIEYYDLFRKQKPTPAKDSCGLCDPEKSNDTITRICTYCTHTLTRIKLSDWEDILSFSIKACFPDWFTNFCKKRASYVQHITPTVEAARESTGMTQKQLADALGVSPRTVQRWEENGRKADKKVLKVCE